MLPPQITDRIPSLPRADKLQLLHALAARWPADPAGYVRDWLGQRLTPQQAHICHLLTVPPYRVLVRSANNLGKSFLSACLCSWHFDAFRPGVTLATASVDRQVRDILFKELRRLRPVADGFLPKANRLEDGEDHFVHGFTARDADSFKGQHEGHLFMLFDEGVGVDREFWSAGETMYQAEPETKWLATYNPTDTTSYAFAAEASELWHVVHLNALEHPNVAAELRGEPPPIKSAVRLNRLRTRIESECEPCGGTRVDATCFEFPPGSGKWHKPATLDFEVQVLGRWPSTSFDGVWSPALWEKCQAALPLLPTHPVQIGNDCARFGRDKTSFAVRKGVSLLHLEVRSGWDTQQIARRNRELCHLYAPPGVDPKRVPCVIDDTGGYGSGVVDYPEGYRFVGVNSSEKAIDEFRYPNKRSELWLGTRAAADAGGFCTGHLKVGRELLKGLSEEMVGVKYTLDGKGRRMVEGKKHTKVRLGHSPDLADGVNLAWYPV